MQLQIDQCYIEERDSMTMYNWADLTCPAWRFRNGFSMETVSEEISKGFRGLIRICEDGTFQVEDSLCGGPDVGEVKRKRPEMLRSSQPKAECFAMWGRGEQRPDPTEPCGSFFLCFSEYVMWQLRHDQMQSVAAGLIYEIFKFTKTLALNSPNIHIDIWNPFIFLCISQNLNSWGK